MELQHIKRIQDQIICNSFYLKLFSLLFLFFLFLGCENSKTQSIKINEDLYLMPSSKNKQGCTQFKMMSRSEKPTTQIIYTVNKKGKYSPGQIKDCI